MVREGWASPQEMASLLGVSLTTLAKMRHRRRQGLSGPKSGPPFLTIGHRTVRYDLEEFRRWSAYWTQNWTQNRRIPGAKNNISPEFSKTWPGGGTGRRWGLKIP